MLPACPRPPHHASPTAALQAAPFGAREPFGVPQVLDEHLARVRVMHLHQLAIQVELQRLLAMALKSSWHMTYIYISYIYTI